MINWNSTKKNNNKDEYFDCFGDIAAKLTNEKCTFIKNEIKNEDEKESNDNIPKFGVKLDEDINPKSFKNLYRKIAFETHPDKGYSKIKVKLFNEAKEAYTNGSWFNLVEIASILGIILPNPTKQQLESLSLEGKEINSKITIIKNSVSWNWYFTKGNVKKQLMNNYIKSILNK